MKKVAFFGWYSPSSFNTMLSVLDALKESGIEIHYFGFEIYQKSIEGRGIKFYKYDYSENIKINEIKNPKELTYINLKTNLYEFQNRTFGYFMKLAEETYEKIKEINPDVIIRDYNALNGKIVANRFNKKCIGINSTISILNNNVSKNPIKLYSQYNGTNLKRVKNLENDFYDEIIGIYKNICNDFKLSNINPVYNIDGEDDLNICFGGTKLQKVNDNRESKYRVVKYPLKNFLDEFDIKVCNDINFNNEKPVIYFASGLLINARDELNRAIIKLSIKNDYNLIFVSSKKYNFNKNIPENIKIVEMVDQHEILKKSNLFISLGGFNSICESIEYKVPLLIIPHVNDQYTNANVVKELGIGEVYISNNPKMDEIERIIYKLLNDNRYKINISKTRWNCNQSPDITSVIDDLIQGRVI